MVSLGDAPPESLEVQIVDEAGNVNPTRGSSAALVSDFHGQPGAGGGCACGASSGGGTSFLAGALLVGLALIGRRRRKRVLSTIAILALGGLLDGCSCSHNACGSKACEAGEVTRGAIGRWNSIATDGTRTVATTYDQMLGDLVLVELGNGDPQYSVIDGIPDGVTPTFDPSTYRGGVEDPGPDVGAWSSVALQGSKVRVAYQDRDRHALRFAADDGHGGFATYDVDVPVDTEQVGGYASLAIGADGAPAIAYIATGTAGDGGTRTTELRLARARNTTPSSMGDWTVTTVATGVRGCAGQCGSDKCVKSATAGQPETCVTPTSDCSPACGSGTVCAAAACLTEDGNEIISIPGGVGLFANLIVMPDGRLVIVHYDMVRTALVAEVESAANSNTFAETVLDGMDATDRGQWASAVVDSGGTIHVGYQDALTDEVFYTTFANGAAGTPELVDDGTRTGDRTHNVGGGATIWVDSGTPRIAYQDGLSSDLVIATRGGSGWSHDDAATGVTLDGFHIAAPPAGGWLVWDGIDKTAAPASTLQIKQNP
jgi:MYXO-CTERM domain-containing protein